MNRWLIWSALMIVWTVALQFPVPDPGPSSAGEFITSNKFLIGKTMHIGVYVVLAALSAWVPTPARYRWIMMFALMFHAWGTEMVQETLEPWCHRGGSLSDVGLDVVGIIVGTAASWKWWTRE